MFSLIMIFFSAIVTNTQHGDEFFLNKYNIIYIIIDSILNIVLLLLRSGGETPPLQLHLNNIDVFLNYDIFPNNYNEHPAW